MDTEEQKDIFNIFHDGSFTSFRQVDNDIHFEVDLEYLAQMFHPDYHLFKGILKNCRRLAFIFWDEVIIEDRDAINALVDELEIARADCDADGVRVFCNRSVPLLGGYFVVVCDAIHLFDEGGQATSIDDISKMCQDYWPLLGKG
jgi:hypothetical protein